MNDPCEPPPDDAQALAEVLRLLVPRLAQRSEMRAELVLHGWRLRLELGPADAPAEPVERPDPWATGPEPKFTAGFRRVYWPGAGDFRLSPKQADVVERLWEAYEEGTWEVHGNDLLRAADSDGTRIGDLFKRFGAWGKLIVPGEARGSYRLAPLPGDHQDGDD